MKFDHKICAGDRTLCMSEEEQDPELRFPHHPQRNMAAAFIPVVLIPSRFPIVRHRPRNGHIYVCAKGKGFDKSQTPKKQSNPQPTSPEPLKPPNPDEPFTPRGPTLRAEYEKRGLVEPTITSESGILPEIVADRMLRRILTFAGIPLSLLFSFFGAYFILKYKYDITVLPAVVAYSTLGTIALSGMGISYGIFSSSWDEDDDGTKLGLEEAKKNIIRAKDGLLGAREREIRDEEFEKIDKLRRQSAAQAEKESDEQ